LANRGIFLKEQVISYFSKRTQNFIAAAIRPIPQGAVIPVSDLNKKSKIYLKIWPSELILDSHLSD